MQNGLIPNRVDPDHWHGLPHTRCSGAHIGQSYETRVKERLQERNGG